MRGNSLRPVTGVRSRSLFLNTLASRYYPRSLPDCNPARRGCGCAPLRAPSDSSISWREYSVSPLAASPLAIFVRQDHPLVAQTLTADLMRQYPQVALYVADREELIGGQVLARGLFESDRGILETSHLLTAFEILRETDYLLICPAYLARNEGATRDIVALTLPVEMTFSVQYSLIAHRRTEHSPIHQWLWQEIIDTVQSMRFRTVHRG